MQTLRWVLTNWLSSPIPHILFLSCHLPSRSRISTMNLTNHPYPSQAAAPFTFRNTPAHHAVTQLLRSVNVLLSLCLNLLPIRANESNRPCRQLGLESQAEKDNRNRPHAYAQKHFPQVPEWVPDWCAKGCKGAYNLEIKAVYLVGFGGKKQMVCAIGYCTLPWWLLFVLKSKEFGDVGDKQGKYKRSTYHEPIVRGISSPER